MLSYCCFSEVLCYYFLLSLPHVILSISCGKQTLGFPCSVTQLIHSHFLDCCFTPALVWVAQQWSCSAPAALCSSPTAIFWPTASLLLTKGVKQPLAVSWIIQTQVMSWFTVSEVSGTVPFKCQRCRSTGLPPINASVNKMLCFSPPSQPLNAAMCSRLPVVCNEENGSNWLPLCRQNITRVLGQMRYPSKGNEWF